MISTEGHMGIATLRIATNRYQLFIPKAIQPEVMFYMPFRIYHQDQKAGNLLMQCIRGK
jgi:hypothetical protein